VIIRVAVHDEPLRVITCFAAAAAQQGTAAALTYAAAGCFTLMLAMTLTLNMPINLAIFRWDEERGDPGRWRQLRLRWDLIHTGRVLLDGAGSHSSPPQSSSTDNRPGDHSE
jgi:anthrone oxygenase-like protein